VFALAYRVRGFAGMLRGVGWVRGANNEKMKLVRIIRNWQWPDLMQQTPGHTGIWNDIQFAGEPVEACDYLVILNNLEEEVELRCPWENVWRIVQEPPMEFFKPWHVNPPYATKTFTCDPDRSGPQYMRSHPMLPWHVNRNYDYLSTCPVPKKSKTLSWITTTKTFLEGHKKRMRFLEVISGKIAGLDLLGTRVIHITKPEAKKKIADEQQELGFEFLEDKWAGLAPYTYSLAIENHSGPDYWTEKIADCFLAWTIPIYYGCTNLEDYFPPESFISIDIENPDEALADIKRIIKSDNPEARIPALEKARGLVLNKYQLFPYICDYIHSLSNRTLPAGHKCRKIRLTPTGSPGSSGMEKSSNKNNKTKLSVVVCTYNREQILPDCLESLANQRADSTLYEVLVINNNSTDNTQQVADEFARKYSNFKVLFEKKQGLSHARNLGVKGAAADYIAFIDDDARASENWIKNALEIIDEKKPDIFGGPAYPLISSERPSWYKDEYGIRGDMGETGWLKKGFIVGTNIFFKKSLLEEYGGFDADLGMKGDHIGYHEETRIVFRALKEKKKVYYSKELAVKDQLPDYKKSLVFFIYSKYKAGFDGPKLWDSEFESSELLNLLKLIDQTMNELNFALLKRDPVQFKYPENYLIEKSIKKFFSIGQRLEFFLREDKLMEKLLDSYLSKGNTAKISEKLAGNNKLLKILKELVFFKFKHLKSSRSEKSAGKK
jgi:glycosyltransferase involved in cell wall biosynthesis